MTTVSIPESVAKIGSYAFFGCSNLIGITIPEAVISIGDYAFSGCSSIAYFNGEEGELNVPSKVVTIGNHAFKDLSLITKVVVPNSVTSIGEGAFRGCNSLVEMTLPFVGETATGTTNEGLLGYIFNGTGSNKPGTVQQYYHSSGWNYYYIPNTLRIITVTNTNRISYGAFMNCDFIETITLPDTVESIGDKAFYNCNATIQYFSTEN